MFLMGLLLSKAGQNSPFNSLLTGNDVVCSVLWHVPATSVSFRFLLTQGDEIHRPSLRSRQNLQARRSKSAI